MGERDRADAILVRCPWCRAQGSVQCVNSRGEEVKPHLSRIDAAKRAERTMPGYLDQRAYFYRKD